MATLKKYYDLNVPLTSSSAAGTASTSWTRKQLSQIYQTRTHQLGYSGVAFCHTSYGRLDINKDDADAVLPWRDLIYDAKGSLNEDESCAFGRMASNGMNIYRRINIVLEEVTDVSRLLLPTNDQSASAIDQLLQKYDIVSLQPMNEPTLQNICELLPSNDSGSNTPSRHVDIIVLEYATGSRGGYGLPYRIRKDNIIKAMEAGVTFELCYATAMVDPKRRQGFMRTLTEFQSIYNSIQKKHMLLNKHGGKKCKSEQFPLLISSGSRQNYSTGTDEGMVTLRAPKDVHFLVGQTTGGDTWVDKEECKETMGKRKHIVALSAAEKVLMRAGNRSLGVATCKSTVAQKKRKLRDQASEMIRAYVSGISTTEKKRQDEIVDEKSDDDSTDGNSNSLIDWLSAPIHKKVVHDASEDDASDDAEEELMGLEPLGDEASSPERDEMNVDNKVVEEDDEDLEDGYLAL
jgi:hypothetical protein